MAYAQQSDLLLRVTGAELLALTDDLKQGVVNVALVNGALGDASGIIEGFCRSRYAVPLQASTELTRICRDIALYLLYSRRPQAMKETVKDTYGEAMKLLRDISTGRVSLDQPAGAVAQTATGVAVQPSCQDLRFTDCNLEGFV